MTPIIVLTRDRLGCTKQLFDWLFDVAKVDPANVHVADQGSTYEPLLSYLRELERNGCQVRSMSNRGSRGVFKERVIEQIIGGRDKPFFLTDPDVVPSEECPATLLDEFERCLHERPGVARVGVGLRIDDIPDHFPQKADVLRWEGQWKSFDAEWRIAPTATTLCLTRSLEVVNDIGDAPWTKQRRTCAPFIARHTTWYLDPKNMPADEKHYYQHSRQRSMGSTAPGPSWVPVHGPGARHYR